MLTVEESDEYHEQTEDSPTFGVVDDGRKYPAVTARRRQQNGSRRDTLYTVSKNGRYAHLYDTFDENVIQPYRDRKRKRTVGGGDSRVNSANTPEIRNDSPGTKRENRRDFIGFPVNTLDK